MLMIAALLVQPAPLSGGLSNFDCKVLLREGAAVDLTGDFDRTGPSIRFHSKEGRLPLGEKAIPLRVDRDTSTLEGSVAFEKKWLNFDIHPSVDRSTSVARIEFRLESAPPMAALVELNSLYGVALCNIKHSDTQS